MNAYCSLKTIRPGMPRARRLGYPRESVDSKRGESATDSRTVTMHVSPRTPRTTCLSAGPVPILPARASMEP